MFFILLIQAMPWCICVQVKFLNCCGSKVLHGGFTPHSLTFLNLVVQLIVEKKNDPPCLIYNVSLSYSDNANVPLFASFTWTRVILFASCN